MKEDTASFYFISFVSISKGAANFIQFFFLFYPILHITAVTTYITDNWDLPE